MEEPSYKCYQNLYDHLVKLIQYLKFQKDKKRLYSELLFLSNLIKYKSSIKTMNMNYPFYISSGNIEEHLSSILYEFSKYKIPPLFKKPIHRLEKYLLRHQKN